MFTTRTAKLFAIELALFLGKPTEWERLQPLPCVNLFHEQPKRSKPAIGRWPFSNVEPFVAWQGWFTREFVLKQPWLLLDDAPPPPPLRFQNVLPNGTSELCGSWVDLNKLVSRQGCPVWAHAWLYAQSWIKVQELSS